MNILTALINETPVTTEMIADALYEICDNTHSQCNDDCPVYEVKGCVPDSYHEFHKNRGCDCYRNGYAMLNYIRDNKEVK